MSKPPVNESATWSWDFDFDRFEECGSGTRSTAGFPNCAFARVMTFALVRAEQGRWSFGVETFGGNDECRNLLCSLSGVSHCRFLVQFLLDDIFNCVFEFFVIEATLVIADRDDSFQNLIDLEDFL
jgi:hypothetical protein